MSLMVESHEIQPSRMVESHSSSPTQLVQGRVQVNLYSAEFLIHGDLPHYIKGLREEIRKHDPSKPFMKHTNMLSVLSTYLHGLTQGYLSLKMENVSKKSQNKKL